MSTSAATHLEVDHAQQRIVFAILGISNDDRDRCISKIPDECFVRSVEEGHRSYRFYSRLKHRVVVYPHTTIR